MRTHVCRQTTSLLYAHYSIKTNEQHIKHNPWDTCTRFSPARSAAACGRGGASTGAAPTAAPPPSSPAHAPAPRPPALPQPTSDRPPPCAASQSPATTPSPFEETRGRCCLRGKKGGRAPRPRPRPANPIGGGRALLRRESPKGAATAAAEKTRPRQKKPRRPDCRGG